MMVLALGLLSTRLTARGNPREGRGSCPPHAGRAVAGSLRRHLRPHLRGAVQGLAVGEVVARKVLDTKRHGMLTIYS